MNKTELLDRCARSGEERVLLARVLDKLELSQNRGVPAHTPFLSPGEQASVGELLNAWGRPRCIGRAAMRGRSGRPVSSSPTGRSRRTLWPIRRVRWPPWRPCFPGTPPCPTVTSWAD